MIDKNIAGVYYINSGRSAGTVKVSEKGSAEKGVLEIEGQNK